MFGLDADSWGTYGPECVLYRNRGDGSIQLFVIVPALFLPHCRASAGSVCLAPAKFGSLSPASLRRVWLWGEAKPIDVGRMVATKLSRFALGLEELGLGGRVLKVGVRVWGVDRTGV